MEYAKAYDAMRIALDGHISEKAGVDGMDPHGIKAYMDAIETKAKDTADAAKSKANIVENMLAGKRATGMSPALYLVNLLGGNTDVIATVKALLDRIAALEKELNTLSLLQFDNVPVGAGIRWYKETLPADGTYVWANGQTLYGVNQNFPELARVWELGSSDNVVVPKEDHTIFKVRKADRKVTAIQHAYIEAASGVVPTTLADVQAAIQSLTGTMATLQSAVSTLSAQNTQGA
jgi:hypothetical protein